MKRRGIIKISLEKLKQELNIKDDIEITNIEFDASRDLITLIVYDKSLHDVEEGCGAHLLYPTDVFKSK